MAAEAKAAQVPAKLIELAFEHYSMHGDGLVANILAGVLPEHERMIREQVAAEIEADSDPSPWESEPSGVNSAWIDSRDCTKAAAIARGGR